MLSAAKFNTVLMRFLQKNMYYHYSIQTLIVNNEHKYSFPGNERQKYLVSLPEI